MSDTHSLLVPVLEPLRESLRADGAELEYIDSGSDEEILFRLDLTDSSCRECVLPKEQLEQILLFTARKAVPGIRSVTIDDPRTGEESAAAH
jgi:hypothetical protein